jgi:NTP pyrophosphatase (non-canonical NTP hydrolase)
MNANEYQKKTIDVAIYPGAGTGDNRELVYLALGLSSEAGEVAGKVKKLIRDGLFEPKQLGAELGDCCWYVARLAEALGYDFETILRWNFEKLKRRKEENVLTGYGDDR